MRDPGEGQSLSALRTPFARDARGRLLFVAGSAHPLGGLMTWLNYVVPGLAARGWSPVLGLVQGPRHHRPERLLAEHPHERWIDIPCRTGTPEGRCRALARALEEVRPAVAVGVNIPDLYPAIDRARRAGSAARGLLTIHGIEPDLYADAARFRDVVDGAAATNRLACRLLEQVSGLEAARVFYAPYGVESAGASSERMNRAGPFRIGYAGRLEQSQKRVLDLPEIATALRDMGVDVEWLVAGSGPEEDALRRGLPEGETRFLGAEPAADLPVRFFGEIDALIVPSRWETGPLVAWEAMAAGVPVVASRYLGSGLEAALRDEENALLFGIGDAPAAARQLARLARDAALVERLVSGGRALVRERYARSRSLDAWERALESVLALPARSPARGLGLPRATGRLERWLGPKRAESVREALRRTGPDAGSGGEWPHAYGRGLDDEEFLRRAAALDRDEGGGSCSRP